VNITPNSDNFVYIYNQNFKLPNTKGLKVEVGFGQSKVISVLDKSIFNSTSGQMVEAQITNCLEDFTIESYKERQIKKLTDVGFTREQAEVLLDLMSAKAMGGGFL
jgi:hypothetical protein